MPRTAGWIDVRKSEAILDAAAAVLAERGLAATMEEIARRAGVSKQTLYNRYAGKLELARALAERKSALLSEPLEHHEEGPEPALRRFAEALLSEPEQKLALYRMLIGGSTELPELAREVWAAGPRRTVAKLVQFLSEETASGGLAVDDPQSAAEIFLGMVNGHWTFRDLMGAATPAPPDQRRARAAETAARFVRAYAPAA